ncbi:uncharacterized protein BCR38DRAFT_481028 [Pseudomassariella vexata]|uniref:Uncharacterized protein n=1 Tax=Pseudomassariella vexata TaxID=1141098 RepID=A0A1Y2EF20_9PEZI|nr:uncharacterized protein BCR38DRAFT_481028 [Pseudomassariella vexata]ORY69866.1 hypothetical protein BCR38DRAFT_481028 [Pseudomassariella vexata]
MAPFVEKTLSVIFDYRGQLIENCEFISSEDDYVSLITIKEPSGKWKAVVIRSNDDSREALLAAGPCETVQNAIETLHEKSCEAVHLYIKANGYSQPRDLKKVELEDDDDADSVVSGHSRGSESIALSIWDSSDEEVELTPASSSKDKISAPKASTNSRKSRKGKAKSSDAKGDDSEDEPRNPKLISPLMRPPGSRCAPPPPPGWTGGVPPPPPCYRGPGGVPSQPPSFQVMPPPQHLHQIHQQAPLPHPGFSGPGGPQPQQQQQQHQPPPGPRPLPPGSGSPRIFDVRLTIKWLHHSEQRIFESSRASVRALQDTALSYVRSHTSSFDNITPHDQAPAKLWNLRAVVKKAFFGNEAYDMTTYRGDDLSKLFNVVSANDIPQFDIEVDYVRLQMQPPMPPGRVAPPPLGPGPMAVPGVVENVD